MNVKPGFMATSILEELTKEYILVHTVNGNYTGNPGMLTAYDALRQYNHSQQSGNPNGFLDSRELKSSPEEQNSLIRKGKTSVKLQPICLGNEDSRIAGEPSRGQKPVDFRFSRASRRVEDIGGIF